MLQLRKTPVKDASTSSKLIPASPLLPPSLLPLSLAVDLVSPRRTESSTSPSASPGWTSLWRISAETPSFDP